MEQDNRLDTLKVQALTQRVAQLVASYEDQMATFRAQASMTVENLEDQLRLARERIAELEGASQSETLEEE